MISQPVEITWSPDGIEVIYAIEAEWVNTRQDRRNFEAGR